MALDYEIDVRNTHVHVSVSGEFGLRAAQAMTGPIFDACQRHRRWTVLMDVRAVRGRPLTMDRYLYAISVADAHDLHVSQGRPPIRFALLGSEPLIDPRRFGERVAKARDVVVKATCDPAEALDWLGLQHDEPAPPQGSSPANSGPSCC